MGEFYLDTKDHTRSAQYYDRAAETGLKYAQQRAEKARAMMKELGAEPIDDRILNR